MQECARASRNELGIKAEEISPKGFLHPLQIPGRPYSRIHLDFQGLFPIANTLEGGEVTYLFNSIDALGGEVIMIPCKKEGLTSEKCAEYFLTANFPPWGIPECIVTDRDVRFVSTFWKKLWEGPGTTLSMSTSYHPETNGKIERVHRDINAMMRQSISEDLHNWPAAIPLVQFALNSAKNRLTGYSPYQISQIRIPVSLPSWVSTHAPDGEAAEFVGSAVIRLIRARENLEISRVKQAVQANRSRKEAEAPEVAGISGPAPSPKKGDPDYTRTQYWWAPKYIGPFVCLGFDPTNSTYKLALPERYTSRWICSTFHASQLKVFKLSDESGFPDRLVDTVPVYPIDSPMAIEYVLNHDHANDEEGKSKVTWYTQTPLEASERDRRSPEHRSAPS
ncbi:BQ2448_2370 [Microbotryum intermedium]|uniref:BQ2448_2370 protein n=1 Tax=Microbotryum intermedium TaxID=269621 RepID=A0A238F617_9BASI|nr:BQ2448_2370 [Microbotryum intermedium]